MIEPYRVMIEPYQSVFFKCIAIKLSLTHDEIHAFWIVMFVVCVWFDCRNIYFHNESKNYNNIQIMAHFDNTDNKIHNISDKLFNNPWHKMIHISCLAHLYFYIQRD